MNDLEFSEGSYGFNKLITLIEENGEKADTTGFTGAVLTITTLTYTEVMSIDCSISSGVVTWAVQNGDTDFSGTYKGQIKITGTSKVDRTFQFSVYSEPKLD